MSWMLSNIEKYARLFQFFCLELKIICCPKDHTQLHPPEAKIFLSTARANTTLKFCGCLNVSYSREGQHEKLFSNCRVYSENKWTNAEWCSSSLRSFSDHTLQGQSVFTLHTYYRIHSGVHSYFWTCCCCNWWFSLELSVSFSLVLFCFLNLNLYNQLLLNFLLAFQVLFKP